MPWATDAELQDYSDKTISNGEGSLASMVMQPLVLLMAKNRHQWLHWDAPAKNLHSKSFNGTSASSSGASRCRFEDLSR